MIHTYESRRVRTHAYAAVLSIKRVYLGIREVRLLELCELRGRKELDGDVLQHGHHLMALEEERNNNKHTDE
jgi:hypothetical protein